jgi:UDP-N-acetylmuramate dehydrogenase
MISLQSQVDLLNSNTLNLPSIASKFIQLEDESDLLDAFKKYPLNSSNTLLIGGGSNLILPPMLEQYVLAFKVKCSKDAIVIREENQDSILIEVEAGVQWDELVEYCVMQGYNGLENLSLIPGTLGAAPIQNIGAYGVEIADCLEHLKVYCVDDKKVKIFTSEQCQFVYRDSIFKRHPGKFIIISVCLRLSRMAGFKLEYGELKSLKNEVNLTAALVRKTVIAARQAKLPDPKLLPNAGSFFKNPIVSLQQEATLKETYPSIVSYPLASGEFKLAAAWLIDQAGWKGFRNEYVGVHDKQALVIVNHNGGKQSDILSLAEKIKDSVSRKFKIDLEIEPILISS